MVSVSFVMPGDRLESQQISELRSLQKSLLSRRNEKVELVLYFDSQLPQEDASGIIFVRSNSKNISSLEKAIAVASGERLIFTTFQNILSDTNFSMVSQTQLHHQFQVGVPGKRSLLTRLLGIRSISGAAYIITTKQYASLNARAFFLNSRTVIRKASKDLGLFILPTLDVQLPDAYIKNLVVFRPTFRILKHKFFIARQKWRNYREKKRVDRLTKQVLPVPYSNKIPVFIICRDRLEPLKKLVKWCEDEGLVNIYFIDNASTYPPLLEYYKASPHEVIYLGKNIGHTSPWVTGIIEIYAKGNPYIVTDPDVVPSPKSHGAVKLFAHLLNKYPVRRKVGFGLRIDNLPDHYDLKNYVIEWEKQFWVSKVEPEVYDAEIDTTFALYRPQTPYVLGPALRTGGNYVAEHEPWYINSSKIPEELQYYRKHADKVIGSWGTNEAELTRTYLIGSRGKGLESQGS